MKIDVAVGEVPWERQLLAAIAANQDVVMGRRLVDIAANHDLGDVLISCPSVRGFNEAAVRRWASHARVIIIRDSIRPPWLDASDFDVRDIASVSFGELVAECAQFDPTPRLQLVQAAVRAPITAFTGVSGGVGVTTLAWMYAQQHPDALIIDCNIDQPALGLLAGPRASALRVAVHELRRSGSMDIRRLVPLQQNKPAVLSLSMHGADHDEVSASDLTRLLVIAAEQFPEVVLDFGTLGQHPWEPVLDHIDRSVVITTATPLGLVRLCAQSDRWSHRVGATAIVVNRIRESAAGSRHVATAMHNLVYTELGQQPTLVADHMLDCDRGWLVGEWGAMAQALGELRFAVDQPCAA